MSNMLRVPVVSRALLQAAALAVRHDQTGCAVVWWLGEGGQGRPSLREVRAPWSCAAAAAADDDDVMIYLFSGARGALMRPTRNSNILQLPKRCQQNSNSGDAKREARGGRCGR
jgi:hypothetical protein